MLAVITMTADVYTAETFIHGRVAGVEGDGELILVLGVVLLWDMKCKFGRRMGWNQFTELYVLRFVLFVCDDTELHGDWSEIKFYFISFHLCLPSQTDGQVAGKPTEKIPVTHWTKQSPDIYSQTSLKDDYSIWEMCCQVIMTALTAWSLHT